MEIILLFFSLIILLFSAIIHEVSHGQMAYFLGDPTAKHAGRLTLNPIKHLDPVGSIFLPLMLILFRSPILFGYAKPVPFNPYNLRNQKWGPAQIAIAGPLSNFLIAIIFGVLSHLLPVSHEIKAGILFSFFGGERAADLLSFFQGSLLNPLFFLFSVIVFLNVLLAIFNLVPIPPLDGSKVLYSVLPPQWERLKFYLEIYGPFLIILFLFLIMSQAIPLFSFIFTVFRIIIGV